MAQSICNKRDAINYSHANTRSTETRVQSVTRVVLILFIVFTVAEDAPRQTTTEDEMRLQVTERIVLIYSNVSSAVRVDGYRYRICRECNGETLQRMRQGGRGLYGGGKRGSGDGGGGGDDAVVVAVVTYKQ